MNTVHLNRERLKQSRQRITINGESRVAYALIEIERCTGISKRALRDVDDLLPDPIFLWGERYYTGKQLSLMYKVYKKELSWGDLKAQWDDPDTDDDLWPRVPEETSRPTGEETESI